MLNWFKNRKIGTRILIGYFIVIVVTAAVGVFSVTSLRRVDSDYALSYADSADALALTEDLSSSFQRLRMNTYGVVLADSKEDKDYYNGRIDNFVQEFRASHGEFVQILEAYDDDLEEKVILQRMEKQYEDYLVVLEDFIKTYAMDTYFRDRAYHELKNGDLRELALELDATIGQLIEEEKQFVNGEIARNRAAANNATIVTIIGIVIGVIVAIVLGMLIARNISSNIKLVVEASNLLAEGDVNVSVEIDTDDELGELAEAFGRMVVNTQEQARIAERIADGDMTVEVNVRSERDLLASKLREIVEKNNEVLGNVVSASEQVAAGAEQVSDSSMSLSQGAAEQASSIEELTASIEQISTQTQENAENANKANQLADGAKVHATQGNDQMKDMLGAMEEINEASANISNIIKVIDDIAFQTNILALNAAVEAARAGQHGKGFAVVAEEVRTLAARSADAANETTELIEGSIRKTEAGTKIAEETAEALYEVIKEIEIVAELVEGIANASNEQAAGIAQINQGVMQVSAVVQANSATSEESAAASEELSSQAALLEELVRQFRLKQVTRRASGPTDLSPEVLQMLENLGQQERRKENAPRMKEGKPQIALSDQEFGKY